MDLNIRIYLGHPLFALFTLSSYISFSIDGCLKLFYLKPFLNSLRLIIFSIDGYLLLFFVYFNHKYNRLSLVIEHPLQIPAKSNYLVLTHFEYLKYNQHIVSY
jgi:hypothetical protein